jgi:hypothetical protein
MGDPVDSPRSRLEIVVARLDYQAVLDYRQ